MDEVKRKLVRDKLALELARNGRRIERARLEERERLILEKILEEARELVEEPSLEEAADLFEALLTWVRINGYDLDDLLGVVEEKRRLRGGFEEFYILYYD